MLKIDKYQKPNEKESMFFIWYPLGMVNRLELRLFFSTVFIRNIMVYSFPWLSSLDMILSGNPSTPLTMKDFSPIMLEFYTSVNGTDYDLAGEFDIGIDKDNLHEGIKYFSQKVKNRRARFIKVHAVNMGYCPNWHPGAGAKSWIFADEIIVD